MRRVMRHSSARCAMRSVRQQNGCGCFAFRKCCCCTSSASSTQAPPERSSPTMSPFPSRSAKLCLLLAPLCMRPFGALGSIACIPVVVHNKSYACGHACCLSPFECDIRVLASQGIANSPDAMSCAELLQGGCMKPLCKAFHAVNSLWGAEAS